MCDVPKFTKFDMPVVSTTKEDFTVTAVISGKNFDAPGVEPSNFSATCPLKPGIAADTKFTINSYNSLSATFTIPGTAGDYDITVSYGSESITGTLKVLDCSEYSVGDVLLNDGTTVRYDADNLTFTDEQKSKAVGVLYYINEYGVPSGWLGIYNNSGSWAKKDSTGYDTEFNDIICTPSTTTANAAKFTGDTDGSDNWAYICSIDPEGTADAAENYPAFNYVNNYASRFGLTGDYAAGWYMPSIAELCDISRSRGILNSVLEAIGGTKLNGIYYWSSSQVDGDSYRAYRLDMGGNYLGKEYKNYSWYDVCCVRKFN